MISRLSHRAALPFLLLMAGCGVSSFNGASSGAFSIVTPNSTLSSNSDVQLSAILPSGSPANVVWSVAGGDNASSLGEGHIDATGLYTAPNALSQDSIHVQIAAHLAQNATAIAETSLTVTPGFVQPLLPEVADLSTGSSLEATAEIAEVNAGSVHWTLHSPDGDATNLGVLSDATCSHTLTQYTACKVTYIAPASFSGSGTIFLEASVNGSTTSSSSQILLNRNGFDSNPATNQAVQTGPIALGSSGGNDNDYDTYVDSSGESYIADCCGGTLGALVEDSAKNQFILSNNHVLAESDQGKIGDSIDEPGLIDDGCIPLSHAGSTLHSVGTLKYVVPLKNAQTNVDAALAAVTPGAVDASGSILQLGTASSNVNSTLGAAPPMAGTGEVLDAANLNGLELAKSGRTTGLTCSSVAAVDLSVKVDYFKDCAETQPYLTKIFNNQIGIEGDRFSDSGDSGSLVVDTSNAEPVGLFFAGGTDGQGHGLSVANPIGDVLQELSAQTGSQLSIVGTTTPHAVSCIRYATASTTSSVAVGTSALKRAQLIAEADGLSLVNPEAGILGVAVGKSLDSPGEAALIVYTDESRGIVSVPQTVDGLRTQVIATDAASLARGTAASSPAPTDGIHLSATMLAGAKTVENTYAAGLLKDSAIFGVGVGQSLDNSAEPALLVLIDTTMTPHSMPVTIGGIRVRYMKLHRFHVTKSKHAGAHVASSCALKKIWSPPAN